MAGSELDDYFNNRRYKDGLAKCVKLLKKSPNDAYLLISKAWFLRGLDKPAEAQTIINNLLQTKPPVSDPQVVDRIEAYLAEPLRNIHPPILTLGSEANTLWNNATASLPKGKATILHNARFENAVQAQRWVDVSYVRKRDHMS